jgi:hypothetical protein
MKLVTCDNMQRLIVLSGALLVTGLVLFAVFLVLGGPSGGAHGQHLLYLSFGLILASPLTLLINLLLGALPRSRHTLKQCSD